MGVEDGEDDRRHIDHNLRATVTPDPGVPSISPIKDETNPMEVIPHKHRLKRGEKVLAPGEKPVIRASEKSVAVPKTKSDTKRVTVSIDNGNWVILRDYYFSEKKCRKH